MVTHSAPANAAERWPRTTFVDGVEAAIAKAREIAGDKDVTIASANVIQQALDLGLVDEVCVSLVPVLFGEGDPLLLQAGPRTRAARGPGRGPGTPRPPPQVPGSSLTALTPALVCESAGRDDMAMPPTTRVLVLGSGFAGLWAALGAARRLDELGAVHQARSHVTVVSSQPFHDIRVRNYEADLSACRIPLQDLLDPAGVGHITADVTGIDAAAATVSTADGATLGYDRLVLALGSRVAKPDLPGLAEFGYDVDTYDGAMRLQAHIRDLAERGTDPASATAVVVGAGLTGIETASELPRMLSDALGSGGDTAGDPRRPQPARRFGHG